MIPVGGYRGRKVLVLGLGRSGFAAARALRAGGAEVSVWDDGAKARGRAGAEGLALVDPLKPGALDGLAALVVSPGIAHLYPEPHPAIGAAWDAGVPVDNDIGLFFDTTAGWSDEEFDRPPRVVAITGSNGKSTTSALVHHILTQAGVESQLAGNIGRGVFDIDPPGEGGVVVLELSSYQTDLARRLAPDVAVFLNLTPDHLDRHGGIGGYFAAKRRLFVEGAPEVAVIGVDEAEGRCLAGVLGDAQTGVSRVIRVASGRRLRGAGWSVFARKGFLAEWRNGRQVAAIDLRGIAALAGAHNHQNACAAYAACRALGLAPRVIEAGLGGFSGLPHRSEVVAQRGGVLFVNDSKATNADSARHALLAFARVRWIAGGEGKAGGVAALAPCFDRVAKAYLIGRDAAAFGEQLGPTPHEICHTLETAVARAAAEAEPGDTVLLAPAAASFDQYPDFERRGEHFKALVARLVAAPEGRG